MNIVTSIDEWCELRKSFREKSIGFVPTMGHLHEGHLQLCQRARTENDLTVVSIFVNPTQFNQTTDFERYPRTFEKDCELLTAQKMDYLFCPEAPTMYPDHYQMQVVETELSQSLEGEHRPGHFTGMLTVVLKLLNLVQATRAYFGEKDYQQLLLVKKMVAAFFIPTDIIACKTMRAADGLALSSRNSRLTPEQRQQAALLPQLLMSSHALPDIIAQLQQHGFTVDYIAEQWGRRLAAVWLGDVRLIDNIAIE